MIKTEEELIWEAYQYRNKFKVGYILYVVGETKEYDKNHKHGQENQEMINDINSLTDQYFNNKYGTTKENITEYMNQDKDFFEQNFTNLNYDEHKFKSIKGKGGAVFNNIEDVNEFIKELKQEFPRYKYYRFELEEPYQYGDVTLDDGIPVLTKPKVIDYESKVLINI